MSLYGLFKKVDSNGFGYNSTAEEVSEGLDLSNKTFLLTGCNSGLGEETLRVLTLRGARVIGIARTIEKANIACEKMNQMNSKGEAIGVACDLSDPQMVLEAVKKVQKSGFSLDGIIANAGIMALPQCQETFGNESQFFTNHVGHFILITNLLDQLSEFGRVVMLSSKAHFRTYEEGVRVKDPSCKGGKYSAWEAYGQSKLANLLFANHLSTRLPKPTQTANSVHPGVIATNLTRHLSKWIVKPLDLFGSAIALKTVSQGAATQVFVATHPSVADVSGEYFIDCATAKPSIFGQDAQLAADLWEKTEKIVENLSL